MNSIRFYQFGPITLDKVIDEVTELWLTLSFARQNAIKIQPIVGRHPDLSCHLFSLVTVGLKC